MSGFWRGWLWDQPGWTKRVRDFCIPTSQWTKAVWVVNTWIAQLKKSIQEWAQPEIRGSIRKRHLRIPQPEDLEVELITPKSTKRTLCCVGACSSQSLSSCQVPSVPCLLGSPPLRTGPKSQHVSICALLLKQEEKLHKRRRKKGEEEGYKSAI